jgi:hypothetical protein
MKRVIFLSAILICIYCIISCTKTNNVTTTVRDSTTIRDSTIIKDTIIVKDTVVETSPKNPIVGLWVGAYFLNGLPAVDSFQYQFDIRPDSTIYTIGSGTNGTAGYASGPWALHGTAFSATLTSMNGVSPENVQTITATYDSVSGTLFNGIWIDTQGNGGQTGTFTVRRVQ